MPLTVSSRNTPSTYAPEERLDPSSSSRCDAMLSLPIQSRDGIFSGELSMPDFPLFGLGDVNMPKSTNDGILQVAPRKKLNFSRESEEEKMSASTQGPFRELDIFRPPATERCAAMLSPPIQSHDQFFSGELSVPEFPLLGLDDVKMPKTSTDGILQLTPRKKFRESEEEKMVALTQGPFRELDILRPPSSEPNKKFNAYRAIRFTRSDEVSHHRKPMPSITLNLQKGWHGTHSRSPRHLPRPVP